MVYTAYKSERNSDSSVLLNHVLYISKTIVCEYCFIKKLLTKIAFNDVKNNFHSDIILYV